MSREFAKSVFLKRRIRTLLISSSALFLLFCFCCALPIQGFVSTAQIDLSVSGASDTHQQQFQRLVETVLKTETSDQGLANQWAEVDRGIKLNSGTRVSMESAQVPLERIRKIRNGLKVGMSSVSDATNVPFNSTNDRFKMTIRFVGSGTQRDSRLVQTLAKKIAIGFQEHPLAKLQGMPFSSGTIASSQPIDSAPILKARNIVAQIEGDVQQARHAVNQFVVDATEKSAEFERIRVQQVSARQKEVQRIEELRLEQLRRENAKPRREEQELNTQLESLVAQRDQLLVNYQPAHPEVTRVQSQIESLRVKMASLKDQWTLNNDSEMEIETESQENKFLNVGFARNSIELDTDILNRATDSLDEIETDSLRTQFTELESMLDSADQLITTQDHQLSEVSGLISPQLVNVHRVVAQRSRPVGMKPGLGNFLFLGLCSLLLGSFIALSIRPEKMDRGFSSIESVSNELGVPVIGGLQSNSEATDTDNENKTPLANRGARLCEFVLMAILILIVGFILIDTNVRQSFFANPFDGLARIVWRLTGR